MVSSIKDNRRSEPDMSDVAESQRSIESSGHTGASHESLARQGPCPPSTHRPGRWWLAVLAGIVLSIPLGWVLSYVASIPYMIGVFFFALLGLLLGACVFRVARPKAPYPSAPIITGTTLLVVLCWGISVYVEAQDLPFVMADTAARNTRDIADLSIDEFQESVMRDVRRYLAEQYPPGGTLGYVRWVVHSGEIPADALESVKRRLSVGQRGWPWLVRVVLSLGLLAFGVASQTLTLIPTQKAAEPT